MQKKWLFIFLFSFSWMCVCAQQKPLPDFFVHKGSQNSVVVSWVNNFGDECIQLNVQRSMDSLINFKTIFSTPAPQLPTNGFTDRNTLPGRVFYRIFYMLNGGDYYFTLSKQPEGSSVLSGVNAPILTNMTNPGAVNYSMVSRNKSGNTLVHLNSQDVYNYRMDVFSSDGSKVKFSIKHFESDILILDKGSFFKKGRYRYRIFYKDNEKETGYIDVY